MYDVWYYSYGGGKQVIPFVATSNFSSGTVDLLSFFKYAENKGWLASNAAIDQIGFGPEIVSTQTPPKANNGTNATFYIDDFQLRPAARPARSGFALPGPNAALSWSVATSDCGAQP